MVAVHAKPVGGRFVKKHDDLVQVTIKTAHKQGGAGKHRKIVAAVLAKKCRNGVGLLAAGR